MNSLQHTATQCNTLQHKAKKRFSTMVGFHPHTYIHMRTQTHTYTHTHIHTINELIEYNKRQVADFRRG